MYLTNRYNRNTKNYHTCNQGIPPDPIPLPYLLFSIILAEDTTFLTEGETDNEIVIELNERLSNDVT